MKQKNKSLEKMGKVGSVLFLIVGVMIISILAGFGTLLLTIIFKLPFMSCLFISFLIVSWVSCIFADDIYKEYKKAGLDK